ncbi:hypothetical protein ZWY2020_047683 [Hordeum vulgare]|nr:hypothetical protein ZWY2020_047683 [Hordeum vulgare]
MMPVHLYGQTQDEIAVRLSKLEKKGWRPRRTIIVCSWDAEEFVVVPDPDDRSHTLYDYMIRQNPPVAFVQYIGVPSLDISYGLCK